MIDPLIESLVDEALESGKSAEDVCASRPELIDEVRRRITQFRAMESRLDLLIPGSHAGFDAFPQEAQRLPTLQGYEFLSVLGSGGMGIVYLAKHLALGRLVAVKTIRGSIASSADRARFLREARSLGALRHPHIVQVYDVGESNGAPYFTMEHAERGTLGNQLADAPMPPQNAALIAATLADAVACAHRSGIVHRDLKPSNVLVTADGTLKISDFGLAWPVGAAHDLTLSGARIGTPSYMSPEQALGRAAEIGPATDVYSIGAMMYEALTGRPPFRGESAAETERQLLRDEPVPPRLLSANVPRDLETICLKCLQKTPSRRYASAEALADDLRLFLDGRPIAARPAGATDRTIKWARRRPAAAAFVAACIVGVFATGGVVLWFASARATVIAAVEGDLDEVSDHQRRGAWDDARAALARASGRIGNGGTSALRARLQQAETELRLVDEMDAIRLRHAGTEGGVLRGARAAREYAETFRSAGLVSPGDDPEAAAARIRATSIAPVLVAALDDWGVGEAGAELQAWVRNVARHADQVDDPASWRARVRSIGADAAPDVLSRLADEAPVADQPLPFLYAFGMQLQRAKVDGLSYFQRAQRAHPGDFWIATLLAHTLHQQGKTTDSLEHYRAAVALRPDTMVSHYNLGRALGAAGRSAEAVESFREAVRLDSRAPDPMKALGLALYFSGKPSEALGILLAAAALDQDDPALINLIARCFVQAENWTEAADWHERAISMAPQLAADKWKIRAHLVMHSEHQLVRRLWIAQLAALPQSFDTWDGYAEFSAFLQDPQEYQRARTVLIERFSERPDPASYERTAVACLLLPSSPQELSRVKIFIDHAAATSFAAALASYRAGDFHNAARIVDAELAKKNDPANLLLVAMTRERLGQHDVSLRYLAMASSTFNWTTTRAGSRESWIGHVLRREAEELIVPDLPRLISGEVLPTSANHRLTALGACQASERFGRWAQLWEDSRTDKESPALHMPHAPAALMLAASARGSDAAQFTAADRARWRSRALETLRTFVDEAERAIDQAANQRSVDAALQNMSYWHSAWEFADVRDPAKLDQLPEEERAQWQALWTRIQTTIAAAKKQ